MQNPKPPIQPLHLLTMRTRVITLLPIPRLLMFPLPHRLRRHRSQIEAIRRARQEYNRQRRQHVYSIDRVKHAGQASGHAADGCALRG